MSEVTRILNAMEQGDRDPKREESRLGTHTKATEELLPLVYEELRLLAAQRLSREVPGQTLQATALVHEAYIRLLGDESQSWDSRGHFFTAAAEAMRRILIENARRKMSIKAGGQVQRVDLEEVGLPDCGESDSERLIALDKALEKLSQRDKMKADLVKLRYFAGLTGKQAAQALGISPATADRYWRYASSWLRLEILRESGPA